MNLSSIIEIKEFKGSDSGFVSYESQFDSVEEVAGPTAIELAEDELQRVKRETAELIVSAKNEVEQIKKDAYEAGFSQGEAEGRTVGQGNFDEKIKQVAGQIIKLAGEQERINHENEASLLALINAMVDKLVHHEVSVNHKVIENCLTKAMTYVVGQSKVVVHLNPEDFLIIKDVVLENPLFLEGAGRVELVEDLTVSLGGCLLKTEFGEIDATLENCREQLDQAVEQAFLAALAEN